MATDNKTVKAGLDAKALEAAHAAYETFGQPGDLKSRRLSDSCLNTVITAYLSALPHVGKVNEEMVEALADFLCSEFDADFNPVVGAVWPEHENDDGYRDGGFVRLQPSDVQAHARGNARRILTFVGQRSARAALSSQHAEAVPVCEQWRALEDGFPKTSWYYDTQGDRAGWEALAKRNPATFKIETRPLYASPVPADAGEPGIRALLAALKPFADIANEYSDQEDDDYQVWKDFDVIGASLPLRHFRAARSALVPTTSPAKGWAVGEIEAARDWLRARWCVEHPNEAHVKMLAEFVAALRTSAPVGQQAKEGGE